MTAFKWKRKAGQSVCKETIKAFTFDACEEEEAENSSSEDLLNLQQIKRPRVIALEDKITRKKRLQEEGSFLAENKRYWEALIKWDEASQLCPNDEKLYEMKAQVLLALHELFPAILAAEQAVKLNPCWWVAYQTLGRAQLSVGEVHLALRSFSKACHINPSNQQLWEDDLFWAHSLIQKSTEIATEEKKSPLETESTISIQEITNSVDRAITYEMNSTKATVDSTVIPQDSATSTDTSRPNHILRNPSWIKLRK